MLVTIFRYLRISIPNVSVGGRREKSRIGEVFANMKSCGAWRAAENVRKAHMESGIVINCKMSLIKPVTASSAAWNPCHALFRELVVALPTDRSEQWNGLGLCDQEFHSEKFGQNWSHH